MTGKRTRQHWASLVIVLALTAIAVAGPAVASMAGSPLLSWLVIGTDASPPSFDQLNPSVAYNPGRQEYLVVWHNERPVYPDIQAQRVGANGRLVGGPFYIAGGPGAQRRYPDVVYNHAQQEYLVVWEELPDAGRADVYAQRVGAQGGLISGATGLGAGPELASCTRPAVGYASTADLYMVVWERTVSGSVSSDIESQVLSGTAVPIGGNVVIAAGTTTVHKLMIPTGIVVIVLWVVLTWMGTPAYRAQASPAEEVALEFVPSDREGMIHEIPWEGLVPGVYDTETFVEGATDNPEHLDVFMVELREAMEAELPNGAAALTVQIWQRELKRVDLDIAWPGSGGEQAFEQHTYIHRDSAP